MEQTSLSGSETFENNVINIITNDIDKININTTKKQKKNKKSKKNRCNHCNKKLGLLPITCKCGGSFCTVHRYFDEHNCTYDWKQEGLDKLKEDNPTVVADKVIKF